MSQIDLVQTVLRANNESVPAEELTLQRYLARVIPKPFHHSKEFFIRPTS